MVYFLDCSIGDIHWKSPFLRLVQDWELESMMLFLDGLFTAITFRMLETNRYGLFQKVMVSISWTTVMGMTEFSW